MQGTGILSKAIDTLGKLEILKEDHCYNKQVLFCSGHECQLVFCCYNPGQAM